MRLILTPGTPLPIGCLRSRVNDAYRTTAKQAGKTDKLTYERGGALTSPGIRSSRSSTVLRHHLEHEGGNLAALVRSRLKPALGLRPVAGDFSVIEAIAI